MDSHQSYIVNPWCERLQEGRVESAANHKILLHPMTRRALADSSATPSLALNG